jgi:hypothetical protein
VLGVIAQFDKVGQGCAVGFRERRSGNIPSQADFGRGNAEAEANETNDRERLQTILRLAHEYGLSVRAISDPAAAQQDFGCDLSPARARGGG